MTDGMSFEDHATGQAATATVEVTALQPEKRRATLSTRCTVAGRKVPEGDAQVSVPGRAQRRPVAARA
ncbi:hypothetical protein JYK14_00050 [Siccirubricoccus sp. KC 17139]|uniref:Uncharacterized protein n=1 Tax=Siccirubricoccus soli TaxID=2899147 RepID=A0ABT1CYV3_9PROT|nr:hypothetical protein [Siccirubricoccus soli]MCO6414572.1 hypothetical protein [Siccirubricoccus soli]MCP2680702.1 hypothetical protein [Siccirubricoccus soli]